MSESARLPAGPEQEHAASVRRREPPRTGVAPASPHQPRPAPLAGRATVRRTATEADALGGTDVAPGVVQAIQRRRGSGSRLPDDVAESMGSRFGHDFSGVRVHTGSEPDALSRAVQARAFTVGSDIFFSSGSYAPSSTAGRRVLAHELTHVVQQAGSTGAPVQRSALTVGRADDAAEVEADQVADRVVAALRNPEAAAEDPLEIEHIHGPGCGHEPTVRRIFMGLFGTTAVADAKKGEFEQADAGIPNEFINLSDTIQKHEGMVNDPSKSFGDQSSLSSGHDTSQALSSLSLLGATKSTGTSLVGGGKAVRDLARAEDSFDKNAAATSLEGNIWGLGGGTGGISSAASSIAKEAGGHALAQVDPVTSFYQAGVKGKGAIEDATASARLGGQKKKSKHLQDQQLPPEIRVKRFRQFYPAVERYQAGKDQENQAIKDGDKEKKKAARAEIDAAKNQVKSGDVKRYIDAHEQYVKSGGKAITSASSAKDITTFLDSQPKEFGKGTEHRKAYEASLKEGGGQASENYQDARSLGKVASFGQRRKGEMATVGAVDAAGNALDGAGTFTAGVDLGGTKITGKLLKAGVAVYSGAKSGFKRARRVHKLRKAKNELGYGGKTDRGMLWGAKAFFGSNIEGSMDKAKTSMSGVEKEGVKKSENADKLTDTQRAKLLRMLTLQAQRRVDDLIRCLGSDNDRISQRAEKILHVIAETNLAGKIAPIKSSDVEAFRQKLRALRKKREELLAADATLKNKSAARKAGLSKDKVDKLRGEVEELSESVDKIGEKIGGIVRSQLKGIGG